MKPRTVALVFCLSFSTWSVADDFGASSGDDAIDGRERNQGQKNEIEQTAGTGELEGDESISSLAEGCVKYFRKLRALEFDEFESLWQAREAVRKADTERIAVRRDMDSSGLAALDKDFGIYAFHCGNAGQLLGFTKICLKAESTKARTTQEDVTAAKQKLLEARKAVPDGSTPGYKVTKAYYARIHECEDLVMEFWDKTQATQEDLLKVRRAWFRLPARQFLHFENLIHKWLSELAELRRLAEEAKHASSKGEDGEWPEDRRFEAAKKRFFDCLNRDLESEATFNPKNTR